MLRESVRKYIKSGSQLKLRGAQGESEKED